ncbi:MAG: hypothetical protein KAY24_10990, partial [Candidatus Eisenbacteria sp.]|nr:hypothetical protein [Candidatus Eisenbacteria bacterium]
EPRRLEIFQVVHLPNGLYHLAFLLSRWKSEMEPQITRINPENEENFCENLFSLWSQASVREKYENDFVQVLISLATGFFH